MKTKWRLPLLAGIAMLQACATGTTFKDVSPRISPLPLTQGRIYLYRATTKDEDRIATATIDGTPIGTAQAVSFFFIDHEPGLYQLASGDEIEQKLSLKLIAGQTRFVRLDAKVGLSGDYFVPVAINEIDGAEEILPLNYVGPPLPKRKPSAPSLP